MTPIDERQAGAAVVAGWPLRVLTATIAITACALIGLLVNAFSSYRIMSQGLEQHEEIYAVRGTIARLDESLTMSAKMAAATGDLDWEARYRRFEPELDGAIRRARQLAAPIEGEQAASRIEDANNRLVAMENRAFELVRLGRLEEAQAILSGPWYEAQKRVYAEGLIELDQRLARAAQQVLAARRGRLVGNVVVVALCLGLLLLGWLVVWRALRRYHRELLRRTAQASERAEQLQRLNQSLDQRVAERTMVAERANQESEQANGALRDEIVQREQAQQALQSTNTELLRRERVMQSLLEDLQTSKDALESGHATLQAANQRLEELSRVKDEFVATVSHELRTPLTAIKEGISLLLDEALGDINEEQRDFLHTVDDNIERLTELISNMLDLSKIEAGRLRLFRKRVRVAQLFDDILSNYRAMAGQRSLVVEPGEVPDVFADPNRMLQVLGNLVSNAVKFTPPEATITLRAQAADGHVALSIADTGVGISPEDLPKLFKRFSQVGEGQGRPRGTGLGLALCKELVDLHKGDITVRSEAGKGSTFIVTLPTYTPEFTMRESFEELVELAKGEKDRVVALALDCEPLFGSMVQGLAEDAVPEGTSAARQLELIVEYVRRHLHRGDAVLSAAPRWVVVFAITDQAGLQAIVQRLKNNMLKDLASYAESPEQVVLRFGAAMYPDDGREAHELVRLATDAALGLQGPGMAMADAEKRAHGPA